MLRRVLCFLFHFWRHYDVQTGLRTPPDCTWFWCRRCRRLRLLRG